MSKRALIISYLWPPAKGVGTIRPVKFAKYLPDFGWDVSVLTVSAAQGTGHSDDASPTRVYRTGYRDVVADTRKMLPASGVSVATAKVRAGRGSTVKTFFREMLTIPDEQIGWYKFALEEGKKLIEKEKIDILLSTSPPETTHLIARGLKRFSGLPWVADLRDLWADDHYRSRTMLKRIILRGIEQDVLRCADSIITVSSPLADSLKRSLRAKDDAVKVIENGFDEEDFKGLDYGGNKKFTISYTGKLHTDNQPIKPFLEALRGLIDEGTVAREKITVNFYLVGYDRPDVKGMARQLGIEGVINVHPPVDYRDALKIQRSSDLLLLVQWRGRGSEGWYSAKLFDYLGSRRPILAMAAREGIIEKIIDEASCGNVGYDAAGIRDAIRRFYQEFIKTGRVKYNGKEEVIMAHSRMGRAKALAAIFDSLAFRA